MTRRQSREMMMQILFEMEATGEMDAEHAEMRCRETIKGKDQSRSIEILRSITENLASIDEVINQYSRSWKTTRMPKVDLAVLRLAVGESRYADDVTDAVVISEAINLVRKFSTEQSAAFVHGVLGAILNNA